MGLDETHLDSPRTSSHTCSSNTTYDYVLKVQEKNGRGGRERAEPTVSIVKFHIHITHTLDHEVEGAGKVETHLDSEQER